MKYQKINRWNFLASDTIGIAGAGISCGMIIDKSGTNVDWKTSFIMAIIIGIVLPLSRLKM